MTLEDEKRLALLAALLHLGGRASKSKALDTLDQLHLLNLTDADRKVMRSRNEEYWRNDLAFIRKHLVDAHYLSDAEHDSWSITNAGKEYARHLATRALSQRPGTYVRTHEAAALVQEELKPTADDTAAELTETVGTEGGSRKVWTTRYERDPALRAEGERPAAPS